MKMLNAGHKMPVDVKIHILAYICVDK